MIFDDYLQHPEGVEMIRMKVSRLSPAFCIHLLPHNDLQGGSCIYSSLISSR